MLLAAIAYQLILLLASQQAAEAWWFYSDPSAAPAGKVAVATFDMDDVQGTFKFSQKSPEEPTTIEYDMRGLKGNTKLYHIHIRPVPNYKPEILKNNATAMAEVCGELGTGSHFNPHHVTVKLPPKSAPFDKYETGDIAGKHGELQKVVGDEDSYKGTFIDNLLPMYGTDNIVGRSVVIHKNDGKRWVCASIVETK